MSTPTAGPGGRLTPRDRDAVIEDIRLNLDQLRAAGGLSWRGLASSVAEHSSRHAPSKSTLQQWWRGGPPAKYVIGLEAAVDEYGASVPGYPTSGRTLGELFTELRGGPVSGHLDADGLPLVEVVPPPGMELSRFRVAFGRERDGRTKVIVTVLAVVLVAALVGLTALVRAHGAPDADASRIADSSSLAGVPVQKSVTLDRGNFCSWVLGKAPIPLVSADPVTMRVDARCNYPAEPDPTKDVGTSVYSVPSNDDKTKNLGHIADGAAVRPQCFVRSSDLVEDASKPVNRSRLWIRVTSASGPSGYVPDVNLGGGYTASQLRGMGLSSC